MELGARETRRRTRNSAIRNNAGSRETTKDVLMELISTISSNFSSDYSIRIDGEDQSSLKSILGVSASRFGDFLLSANWAQQKIKPPKLEIQWEKIKRDLENSNTEVLVFKYSPKRSRFWILRPRETEGQSSQQPFLTSSERRNWLKRFEDTLPDPIAVVSQGERMVSPRQLTYESKSNTLSLIDEAKRICRALKDTKLTQEFLPELQSLVQDFQSLVIRPEMTRKRDRVRSTVPSNLQLPTLYKYKIPPDNKTDISGLLRDIHKLDQHIDEELLSFHSDNRRPISLVAIPRTSDYKSLARSDRKTCWIDRILQGFSAADRETIDAAELLVKRLFQTIPSVREKLIPKPFNPLDPAQTIAALHSSNISLVSRRALVKAFTLFQDFSPFCSETECAKFVSESDAPSFVTDDEIVTGKLRIENELIEYWFIPFYSTIIRYVESIKGKALDEVDVTLQFDHGNGKMLVLILVHLVNSNERILHDDHLQLTVSSIKCHKDTDAIFLGTIAERLNEELEKLKELSFRLDDNGIHEDTQGPVRVSLFMASDLAALMSMLGRSGYSSHWCFKCDKGSVAGACSFKTDTTAGLPWTIERIQEHVENGHHRSKNTSICKGVAREPLITAIPIDSIIIPNLHILLGLGNALLNQGLLALLLFCEGYTEEYFEKEVDFFEKEAAKMESIRKQVEKKGALEVCEQDLAHAYNLPQAMHPTGLETLLDRKADAKEELRAATDSLKTAKTAYAESKKAFDTIRSNTGITTNLQTYRDFEEILKKSHIDRASYHGGAIVGNSCRRLIGSERDEIYSALIAYAAEREHDRPDHAKWLSLQEVCEAFEHQKTLATLLNGAMAGLNSKKFDLNEEQRVHTAQCINRFCELWRVLQLSVTHKFHLLETHALDALHKTEGFGEKTEEAIERAHQEMKRDDKRTSGLKSIRAKALSYIRRAEREKIPAVREALGQLESKKRKFADTNRESSETRKAAKRLSEKEKQQDALLRHLPGDYIPLEKRRKERILAK